MNTHGFVILYKERGIVGHVDGISIPERADPRIHWTAVSRTG